MEQFLKEYRPTRPFASNNLANNGVSRKTRTEALNMKYIQPNVKTMRNLITVDIDIDDAAWDLKTKVFDDDILPMPSFITTNPGSSHAHAGWFIDGVAVTDKQIYVFENIRKKMTIISGGDGAYTGSIFRNPMSDWVETEFFNAPLYSFNELNDYTKHITIGKTAKAVSMGEGRNVSLFETGRQWAYSEYYKALKYGGMDYFHSNLENFLIAENCMFDVPLSVSEVSSVARSVEGFLKKKFSLATFEKKQAEQRERSILVRREKSLAKYNAIKEIMNAGHSMKLACDTLGYNYNSVRASWKKWESGL